MISADGYIKITDFGLSKDNISDNSSAKSFCGTPEYLAPEIVEGKGHGQAVDWWSLGSILFEMLTGMPPFYNKDRQKLFNSIKAIKIKFPKYLSADAVDLLQKFFVKDPEKRLGSGEHGLNNIKSHPFFAEIDWDSLLHKKIKPPFIPKLKNDCDYHYFDTFEEIEPFYPKAKNCQKKIDVEYIGYSYKEDTKNNMNLFNEYKIAVQNLKKNKKKKK